MAASRYLEQALFKEQSPAADQLFEERSETLFEPEDNNSFVDIHIQPPWQKERPRKADVEIARQAPHGELSDIEVVSEPPSPVDKCNFLSQGPPRYNAAPGLQLTRVSDSEELSNIASVGTSEPSESFLVVVLD